MSSVLKFDCKCYTDGLFVDNMHSVAQMTGKCDFFFLQTCITLLVKT